MLKPNVILNSIRILKPNWRIALLTRPTAAKATRRIPPYNQGRYYVTFTTPSRAELDPDAESKKIPPEMWLTVLENTATAPWLNLAHQDHKDRLKRAYSLLYQIVLYLGRPQEASKAEQFLAAFDSAIVPPNSEIGRARKAIVTIMRTAVHNISSVPISSSLRTTEPEIFNIFGALQALHDMYLANGVSEAGEVESWAEFWSRAQPVMLALGMKLEEEGYGYNLNRSQKEQEKQKDVGNGKENA